MLNLMRILTFLSPQNRLKAKSVQNPAQKPSIALYGSDSRLVFFCAVAQLESSFSLQATPYYNDELLAFLRFDLFFFLFFLDMDYFTHLKVLFPFYVLYAILRSMVYNRKRLYETLESLLSILHIALPSVGNDKHSTAQHRQQRTEI